jgi:polyphosphate kinase
MLQRHYCPARSIAAMNGLLEPQILEPLYAASQAGVDVGLVVRGMSALRDGRRRSSGKTQAHLRIFANLPAISVDNSAQIDKK